MEDHQAPEQWREEELHLVDCILAKMIGSVKGEPLFLMMKKLFELNNIGLQEMVGEDELDTYFAYTEDLLAKGILIELYEAVLDKESETGIFAIACDQLRSYTFVLYVKDDFMKPLQAYRMVADAIDFISKCGKETILSDLQEIATGFSTSDEFEDMDDRNRVYKANSWKFNTAMELIKGSMTE